jgi:tRNA modification GTPase
MKFTIVDTAGLRPTQDIVEAEGIRRTREQIKFADIILFVIDPTQEIDSQADAAIGTEGALNDTNNHLVIVINKVDLLTPESVSMVRQRFTPFQVVITSATTGIGISELEKMVSGRFLGKPGKPTGETIVVSNMRQKEGLTQALAGLNTALEGLDSDATPELLAVDLRLALTHLSHVVGVDISNEVLNNIFSRFCIGK